MATTDEATFSLERFESTAPSRLRVGGGWTGIDRRSLTEPALILHAQDGSERVDVVESIVGGLRHWVATFSWDGEPATIQRAQLELAGSLVVELPVPPSSAGRRRFGRTRIAVREVEPAALGSDGDPISLHAALVMAREEAAEASEALESAQAEAGRAREETRLERSRRQTEASRLREAIDTLRRLAESSLEQERAVAQQVSAEMSELEATLAAERADAGRMREDLDAAVSARDEAIARLRADAAELERFRAAIDEAQRLSALAAEQAQAEFERLHAVLSDNQRAADASKAENEELRAELGEARQRQEEFARLRTELAGAQDAAELVGTEAERLRRRLAAVRAAVEQPAGE